MYLLFITTQSTVPWVFNPICHVMDIGNTVVHCYGFFNPICPVLFTGAFSGILYILFTATLSAVPFSLTIFVLSWIEVIK
jgi:hypothetical protein